MSGPLLPGAVLLLGLAAVVFIVWLRRWMFEIEPNRVETTRHEVICPDLPPALDGLTICQVSDVHIAAHGRNEAAIAAAIRAVEADLYVFTGDMIYLQSGIEAFFRWFDALGDSARPAVAILGNAENKPFVRRTDVLRGLAARGVPVLDNAVYCFPWGGTSLQIVGVDDPHTHHSDFARAYADADPRAWTLLLCHSPDGALERGDRRADLMLCGHTHGGQVRLPLVGAVVHGTRRLRGLVAGWYSGEVLSRKARHPAGNTRLYVSRGLGMSGFRGRMLCLPELAVFVLRRADKI